MKIKLLCNDLMTRTRLVSRWQKADAVILKSHEKIIPDIIVVDLADTNAFSILRKEREHYPHARIVVFGPHVEAQTLKLAKQAGADEAVVRGKIAERVLKRLRDNNSQEEK